MLKYKNFISHIEELLLVYNANTDEYFFSKGASPKHDEEVAGDKKAVQRP